ncbi:radical SAM/SPASM domain-containing protein [Spirulina sp. CCNP1310]|uniref:radical SAM/SPASM domain-containing protein n=1 Tax=Spirulina sp. CCNP1310 TaxID=3110249 RepID=UPI002B1FC416|nr:radical SAM/SPASM domain-containing protein [Spirulina sp. CCNP1310]MEA5421441.1 radical SAM/SPASM domain-containing protein [Spirulina sp. CCNP1310]
MTSQNQLYQKHNSFVELRNHNHQGIEKTLNRIATLRSSNPERNQFLSSDQQSILQRVYRDLLDGGVPEEPQFTLSPNVVEEIARIEDSDLPRYLIHRYRYEIYPQNHTLDSYPPYLQIEPTSICNYRCVFCYQTDDVFTQRKNGFMGHMTFETFRGIIDQAEGHIEFISLASRGEPLLCPEIEEMLAYTRGKFLNLKMNTNASMLDERKAHAILQSGIQTLVFSADAAQEPLYSQLRVNGKLERVLSNIKQFQKIKESQYRNSKIITRVSGVKFDERQNLDDMEQYWGELVDQVAFVNYNPWENVYDSPLTEVNQSCSDLWRRMFVWWDGTVNPCDVDYKSTLAIGTLKTANTSQLWQSDIYNQLRRLHFNQQRSQKSPCNRCTVV